MVMTPGRLCEMGSTSSLTYLPFCWAAMPHNQTKPYIFSDELFAPISNTTTLFKVALTWTKTGGLAN
ncbi:hypothetical protein VNO77_19131 [Canavalia gladiata]|uniref:Uncharacterized protein n=1 Tax=Canavalia gladiata TaxID=3824 RepID=A0AAN9LM61_CANGL